MVFELTHSSLDEHSDDADDREGEEDVENEGKKKRRRSRSAWNVYLGSRLVCDLFQGALFYFILSD